MIFIVVGAIVLIVVFGINPWLVAGVALLLSYLAPRRVEQ